MAPTRLVKPEIVEVLLVPLTVRNPCRVEVPVVLPWIVEVETPLPVKRSDVESWVVLACPKVVRPVTERVPPTARLVGEKLVAERFVKKAVVARRLSAKNEVEVALVVVALVPVKSWSVVEPERSSVLSVEAPEV